MAAANPISPSTNVGFSGESTQPSKANEGADQKIAVSNEIIFKTELFLIIWILLNINFLTFNHRTVNTIFIAQIAIVIFLIKIIGYHMKCRCQSEYFFSYQRCDLGSVRTAKCDCGYTLYVTIGGGAQIVPRNCNVSLLVLRLWASWGQCRQASWRCKSYKLPRVQFSWLHTTRRNTSNPNAKAQNFLVSTLRT